jgi:hypothetical protein
VTSGRESTCSAQNLVYRAIVNSGLWPSSFSFWAKQKKRYINEQLLRVRLPKSAVLIVPLATLEVKTVEEASIIWLFLDILPLPPVLEGEGEVKLIDGDCVLSRVVLQSACQESLWEEET